MVRRPAAPSTRFDRRIRPRAARRARRLARGRLRPCRRDRGDESPARARRPAVVLRREGGVTGQPTPSHPGSPGQPSPAGRYAAAARGRARRGRRQGGTGRSVLMLGSDHYDDDVYAAADELGATVVAETHGWGEALLAGRVDQRRRPARRPRPSLPGPATCRSRSGRGHGSVDSAGRRVVRLVATARPPPPRARARGSALARRAARGARLSARGVKRLEAPVAAMQYQREWFKSAERTARRRRCGRAARDLPRLDIPYVVNQWWASICSAKQKRAAIPRRDPRPRVPRRRRPVQRHRARLGRSRTTTSAPWGGLPPVGAVRDAALDRARTRASRAAWAAETGRRVLCFEKAVDRRVPRAWWERVAARVGGRDRQRADRPDGGGAARAGRAARVDDRAPLRRGAPRADPRARERAAGVEPAHARPARGRRRPRRSTSSTASPR